MRVALEGDEWVRVPGVSLNELHVGAGSHEARHAGMAQIVEAVTLLDKTGEPQRAGSQTRWRKFDGWSGVPRVDAKTSSSGAYRPRSTARAASSRNAASTDVKSGTERTPDSVFGFRSCSRE
jgi:hypothetical protein